MSPLIDRLTTYKDTYNYNSVSSVSHPLEMLQYVDVLALYDV